MTTKRCREKYVQPKKAEAWSAAERGGDARARVSVADVAGTVEQRAGTGKRVTCQGVGLKERTHARTFWWAGECRWRGRERGDVLPFFSSCLDKQRSAWGERHEAARRQRTAGNFFILQGLRRRKIWGGKGREVGEERDTLRRARPLPALVGHVPPRSPAPPLFFPREQARLSIAFFPLLFLVLLLRTLFSPLLPPLSSPLSSPLSPSLSHPPFLSRRSLISLAWSSLAVGSLSLSPSLLVLLSIARSVFRAGKRRGCAARCAMRVSALRTVPRFSAARAPPFFGFSRHSPSEQSSSLSLTFSAEIAKCSFVVPREQPGKLDGGKRAGREERKGRRRGERGREEGRREGKEGAARKAGSRRSDGRTLGRNRTD